MSRNRASRRARSSARYETIQPTRVPRSKFDRSGTVGTTFDEGLVVPIWVDECLPGDTIQMRIAALCRMATPLHPVMSNLWLDVHVWACPLRLLWTNFERFMGGKESPTDSTEYNIPKLSSVVHPEQGLGDYMGLPTKETISHSVLPFRAYNLIWDQWYRDENLGTKPVLETDDGPDTLTDYKVLYRGKRKDYFSGSLEWPQKGPAVEMPIGATAPVVSTGSAFSVKKVSGGASSTVVLRDVHDNAVANQYDAMVMNNTGTVGLGSTLQWNATGMEADLSSATGATINDIRTVFQIQRMYERDARGGNARYTEVLRSHFGVTSPDARLQRPEFLGGGTIRFNVNPVAQTAPDPGGTTPQANLAAFSLANGRTAPIIKSFVEHSYLLVVASVRGDLIYQQGIDRMWSRDTRFDFFWPSLAHLGEQEVMSKEIYVDGSGDDLTEIWGYQERYGEYRHRQSKVTGRMRSNATVSLDTWNLAMDFGTTRPTLSEDFIKETPPVDRVIAVPSEPHFLADFYVENFHTRPMPAWGTPGQIDHF